MCEIAKWVKSKNYMPGRILRICEVCGKEIGYFSPAVKPKTCSGGCRSRLMSLKKIGSGHNYAGSKYGRLTAIKLDHVGNRRQHWWLFKCDCGVEKVIMLSSVKSGHTKSCGCYNMEQLSITHKKHGDSSATQSKYKNLYAVWKGMKSRCENTKCPGYKWYGEKGRTVCVEWHNYNIFKEWALENGYLVGLTIDRIDNNGNYNPDNCQWITRSENSKKIYTDKHIN